VHLTSLKPKRSRARHGRQPCQTSDSGSNRASIAIDAFRLVTEQNTSGAYLAAELAAGLARLDDVGEVLLFVPRQSTIPDAFSGLATDAKVRMVYPSRAHHPERSFFREVMWIQLVVPRLLKREASRIDYFISPYHQTPLRAPFVRARVAMIMDICGLSADSGYPKLGRGFYEHLFRFLTAVRAADILIPISLFTRDEFIRRFPRTSSRITRPVYLAVSSEPVTEQNARATVAEHGLTYRSYFIAFAYGGRRKGVDLILDAYRNYRDAGGRADIALIAPVRTDGQNENTVAGICYLSNLSNSERDELYKGSLALVFPSRCEGFGYPIVEAMRQGCPVIAWRSTPAAEIVEDTLPLLDSLDPRDIARHMEHYERECDRARDERSQILLERSLHFGRTDYGRRFFAALS
jgi:glycosyltransferase involved in cell wall biosynthesis